MSSTATLRGDAHVIGLVSVAHGVSHFFQLLVAPLFPLIHDDLGVGYAWLGLTTAVFFTVSGVCQFLSGILVDRIGARRLLAAGLALLVLGTLLAGLGGGYWTLLAGAALAGLGNSVFHPADFAILNSRVANARLGHAFSTHGIAGNIGYAAAPVFSVYMASAIGWRGALIAAAVIGAAMLIAVLANWRMLDEHALARDAKRPTAQGSMREVLLVAPVLLCFAYFCLFSVAFTGIQTFGVTSLVAMYDFTVTFASKAVTAYLIGGAFGILTGGFVAARTERHDLVAAAGLAVAACVFLYAAFGGVTALNMVPLFALAGYANGITGPARDLIVRRITPPGQTGKVYGLVYSGLDVGGITAPVFYGWLIDRGLPQGVFLSMVAVTVIAIATVVQIRGATAPR